jgi:PAS domain-containing protein
MHQGLEWIGCYSAICAPIVVGGRAEDALLAVRDAPGRPYAVEDVAFVEAIATRVALGYERVQRVSAAWQTRRRVLESFAARAADPTEDVDAETVTLLLDQAEREDTQVAVALLDVDARHVGCTKAYAALFGEDVTRMVGRHLAMFVEDPIKLHEACERLHENELDMLSVDLHTRTGRRVAFHAATIRRADATKWGVLVVAHTVPELADADVLVDASGG